MTAGQARPGGDARGTAPAGLPARRRWLSWQAIRLHLALLIVVPGCLAAGWFEFTRAQAGNELSWVYVFEWPFFAAFALYLWWRTLHDDQPRRARRRRPGRPAAAPGAIAPGPDAAVHGPGAPANGPDPAAAATQPHQPEADPQLQAWNEYLARLHASDPVGGPPERRGPARSARPPAPR
ncbi:MAG: hypothetical protein ACLPUO_13070 [Streptosporangiaceae bacterium]